MERFVAALVAGGCLAVAGLWVAALAAPLSIAWIGGVLAAVAGAVGLVAGTVDPLAYGRASRWTIDRPRRS